MSSLGKSNSFGYHGLRYRNRTCRCGETCTIKISYAKLGNGGRLYYACPNDTCNMFGWCLPYRSVGSSILDEHWTPENANADAGDRASASASAGDGNGNDDDDDDDDDITYDPVLAKTLSKFEKSISRMEKLLVAGIMVGCFVGTLQLTLLLKKRNSN